MQLLNKAYKTLKDPKKGKQYDVVLSTTSDEQVIILTPEKRDIYLKILEELLPPIKDWALFKWMKNINKLKTKYNGIADNFDNKNLNTGGMLTKVLLQQFTPDNSAKNIKNANIVIKKDQNYSEVNNKLLKIPEVLDKLNAFIEYYGLVKEQLSLNDIKEINNPILQEKPTTKIFAATN